MRCATLLDRLMARRGVSRPLMYVTWVERGMARCALSCRVYRLITTAVRMDVRVLCSSPACAVSQGCSSLYCTVLGTYVTSVVGIVTSALLARYLRETCG